MPTPEIDNSLLTQMVTLLVDGLGRDRTPPPHGAHWLRNRRAADRSARIFRVLIDTGTEDGNETGEAVREAGAPAVRASRGRDLCPFPAGRQGPKDARSLIRWISHRYSNLLMSIWGYTTLIRMKLATDDPRQEIIRQVETHIQNGAFLIHMVLGYLGERRAVAKRLRLNQLIREMRASAPVDPDSALPADLEKHLKAAARVHAPAVIAEATGRVMHLLFQSLSVQVETAARIGAGQPEIAMKWGTLKTLVWQGIARTNQLLNYAAGIDGHIPRQYSVNAQTTDELEESPFIDHPGKPRKTDAGEGAGLR